MQYRSSEPPTAVAVANLLNLEVDVLLFDTTSTYFEAEPDTNPEVNSGFRRRGRSKGHRPDRPQTIINLMVTKKGRKSGQVVQFYPEIPKTP